MAEAKPRKGAEEAEPHWGSGVQGFATSTMAGTQASTLG